MVTYARRCLVCKHVKHTEPDKDGKQESICKLFNHYLSYDDVHTKVDCNSFERIPYTCPSCGADITNSCKRAGNPLFYTRGKNKGKEKKCCSNPDFRKCPNKDCENQSYGHTALICKNCGFYYGYETW